VINIELRLDYGGGMSRSARPCAHRERDARRSRDRHVVRSAQAARAARVSHRLALGFCDDGMLNWARDPRSPAVPAHRSRDDRRPVNARHLLSRLLTLISQGARRHAGRRRRTHARRAEAVQRLHRLGVAIVRTPVSDGLDDGQRIADRGEHRQVDRLVALGVDWIETDDPERLMGLIG
jgi:hypothetical protein